MKKFLSLLCLCIIFSFQSFSQTTYLADTAFTTDIGYGGAPACHKPTGVYYRGWDMSRAKGNWMADVFTVPHGSTWTFDTVIVYGIQENSDTSSTFLNCNLQIYVGTPGLGGVVVWGDTSTNVLVNTGFTGIYSVDTIIGIQSNKDPIMYLKLYLAIPPVLTEGTYWLSWSAAGSLPGNPFSPDKVLPGRVNPSGQMSRQLYDGTWYYTTDSSHTIGMDMIIKASAVVSSVPAINIQSHFSLRQNTPNPFNGSTDISFYLQENGHAKLSIYNVVGQLVSTLVDGSKDAGVQHVIFNAGDLPNGIYFYQLQTNRGTECKQMQILH